MPVLFCLVGIKREIPHLGLKSNIIEEKVMVTAHNPILNGFYPDPSICAVGEDFYLVTSTFAYFPGVPIFHSRDLAHWEQIGNILNRESQLPLKNCGHSKGIFAPVIRYYDGTFYLITTNVSEGRIPGEQNFIVTARNPEGPWSEPYYLGKDALGIDPSLFFDDDGKCYYVGTRPNSQETRYYGDWEIWMQELDLETMRLTGKSRRLWKGAMNEVAWPEGPHIYKKDGYYYLMIAEGGTGPNHSVTVARSRQIEGPYENNPDNPILTHRHLGKNYPVVYVGHGDLVEDINGNWYMVMLGSRPCKGYTNMGRDTFLAKVAWENGWPVVNPGIGKLEDTVEIPLEPMDYFHKDPIYSFDSAALDPAMMMLRNGAPDMYDLKENPGHLRLRLNRSTLKDLASPAYICVRQQHFDYQAAAAMRFTGMNENECAGLAIVQSNEYHVRFEKCCKGEAAFLRVVRCEKLQDTVIAEQQIPSGKIILKIINKGNSADFYYRSDSKYEAVTRDVDVHCLSTEVAGGFTGCTLGMYASGNGKDSDNFADFSWFFYDALK